MNTENNLLQHTVWIGLPSLLFGSFGIGAACLGYLLNETLNKPMSDSLDEADILT